MISSPVPMLDIIFAKMAELRLPTHLPCDHVCYRVATQERYAELKEHLMGQDVLASEAMIAGRPIATFALHTPYEHKGRSIAALELPSPKPGRAYKEGWEHAEFATGEPLAAFMARYPHVTFNTRSAGKAHNPEVSVQLTPEYQVKFHPLPLLEVIRLENAGLAPT